MKYRILLVLLLGKLVISSHIHSVENDGTRSQNVPENQSQNATYRASTLQSSQREEASILSSSRSTAARHVYQTTLHTYTITNVNRAHDGTSNHTSTNGDNSKISTLIRTTLNSIETTFAQQLDTKVAIQSSQLHDHILEHSKYEGQVDTQEELKKQKSIQEEKINPLRNRPFDEIQNEDTVLANLSSEHETTVDVLSDIDKFSASIPLNTPETVIQNAPNFKHNSSKVDLSNKTYDRESVINNVSISLIPDQLSIENKTAIQSNHFPEEQDGKESDSVKIDEITTVITEIPIDKTYVNGLKETDPNAYTNFSTSASSRHYEGDFNRSISSTDPTAGRNATKSISTDIDIESDEDNKKYINITESLAPLGNETIDDKITSEVLIHHALNSTNPVALLMKENESSVSVAVNRSSPEASDTENHELLTFQEEVKSIVSVTIRKCCNNDQFFSAISTSCEPNENITFVDQIRPLLYGFHASKVETDTRLLQICPNTNRPPDVLRNIGNSTLIILSTGEVYVYYFEIYFSMSEYCLELVGDDISSSSLSFAFCSNSAQDAIVDTDYDVDLSNTNFTVRKCCEENQYYNLIRHECEHFNRSYYFVSKIQAITLARDPIELTYNTGTLKQCPNQEPPTVSQVTLNMIRLQSNGEITDVQKGIGYDVKNYCLELIGLQEDDLSLTIVFCTESYIVPKCCPSGSFFDEGQLKCISHESEHLINEYSLLTFFVNDTDNYTLSPQINFITCDHSFPIEESAEKLTLHDGLLCNYASCFNESDYCIEFIGNTNNELKPSGFYCERKVFIKCCPENEILSNEGCQPYQEGNSVLLRSLLQTRSYRRAFDSSRCLRGPGIFLDDAYTDYIKWVVSEDGNFLNVESQSENLKIDHYCIDDYLDNDGVISPGAYVCEEEVGHMIPNERNFFHYLERGSLGKCCPQNTQEGFVHYLTRETSNCELFPSNETLHENRLLNLANFSKEHFHDFPQCFQPNKFYHSFTFKSNHHDHVRITSERTILLVTQGAGSCFSERIIDNRDMCVEFVQDEDGQIYPAAFICGYELIISVYTEKYVLTTVLLGISCFCLLLTLISLFTMRVRRGMVTVRKVNTLAGRILVSFVTSQLIGIIAFALTQHDNSITIGLSDNISCSVLAGFIEFFNLAAFCWNTSICLESLLLTIHISTTSENVKYILHSLWAWGFPLFMTVLVFLIDSYKDQLPCWVVIPQIATNTCFFTKTDHMPFLLYFYLPIFITLVANVVFLVGAKVMRRARLARLENGKKKVFTGQATKTDSTPSRTTGMRTHQNQNTKAESIRIVIWTGVLWFLECLGFVVTRFTLKVATEERWYDYLWYIPTSLNSLRGVGIFVIIVLTPEKRKEITISYLRFKQRFFTQFSKPESGKKPGNKTSFSVDYSSKRFSYGNGKHRNMSVTTVISSLSSSINMGTKFEDDNAGKIHRSSSIASFISSKIDTIRKKSSIGGNETLNKLSNNNNRPKRKLGMIRSISQIDRRMSTASYTGSFLEELEMKEDTVRRKYSMNPSNLQLPKLQEEDSSYEEDSRQQFHTDSSNLKPTKEEPEQESSLINESKDNHSVNDQPRKKENVTGSKLGDRAQKPDGFALNQTTSLNNSLSLAGDSDVTLTELDIDLEPLELEVPIRFPFKLSSSEVNDSKELNWKKLSTTNWTDIDLQLPDDDEDSTPIDV